MKLPTRLKTGFAGALGAAALAGCAVVGPDYTPSSPELPEAWDAPVPVLFEGESPGPWWRHFDDPVMESLITRGLRANIDINLAMSRLREANAAARGVVAGTGPSLDATAEAGVEARHQSGGDDDGETGGAARTGLSGAWEIDLFGGLARSREAAWARVARQQALSHEARRLSVSEIATTYVALRSAERRLALTERSLELQEQTLSLVRSRVDSGLAPALDRVRAQAQVSSLQAGLGPLRTEVDRFRNALAILLAEPPGTVDALLADGAGDIPASSSGRSVGVPADLVRRRPDIRAAEMQLAVATAEIGIAAAELYPRLTLPGNISVGWTGIGEGSVVTSILASLSALFELPLYDGGRRQADVTAAEERLIQATLTYRQTLLQALQDVESALAGYQGSRQRRAALADAVENNRLAYEQSRELYRQGFVNFIDVLDSQRTWNDSLQELANAERDVSLEIINLYTALGATPRNTGLDR
ncbi:MAG: efflux transporter outer membrane subunit [Gammaproteobacteria bacterium]|nr:efflux transporter outer membrane subunit [Gammaproteobacteria bacterium]